MKALEIDPQSQQVKTVNFELNSRGDFKTDFRGTAVSYGQEFAKGDILYYDIDGGKNGNNRAFMLKDSGEAVFGKAYVIATSKQSEYFKWVNTRYTVNQLMNEIVFCNKEESDDLR